MRLRKGILDDGGRDGQFDQNRSESVFNPVPVRILAIRHDDF